MQKSWIQQTSLIGSAFFHIIYNASLNVEEPYKGRFSHIKFQGSVLKVSNHKEDFLYVCNHPIPFYFLSDDLFKL